MGRAGSLAVLLLVVSLTAAAHGDEILFSDSFENCPAGVPVIGSFGGWVPKYNSFNDPGNNIFTNRQSSHGAISLQQNGSHRGCWASVVYHQVPLPTEFLLEVDMMASGEIDNTYRNVCGDNRYDIAVALYSDFNPWGHGVRLAAFGANGVIWGVPSILMNNAAPMRWYHFKMKVDRIKGNVDYWIDGVYAGHSFNPAYLTWGPTLQYLSFESGGGKGWVDNVKVHTDNTAPVTTLSLTGVAGENGWFWSDVLVTLTSTDGGSGVARTEYTFDAEGTWHLYEGPFSVTSKGATTIHYRSIDNMGNVEPFRTGDVKIDRIPPRVGTTDPARSATNVPANRTISVAFSEEVQPGTNLRDVKLYKARISPANEVAVTKRTAGPLLSLTPVRKMAPRTVYWVVVPAGAVKDVAGHPLAADYPPYSFTTSR